MGMKLRSPPCSAESNNVLPHSISVLYEQPECLETYSHVLQDIPLSFPMLSAFHSAQQVESDTTCLLWKENRNCAFGHKYQLGGLIVWLSEETTLAASYRQTHNYEDCPFSPLSITDDGRIKKFTSYINKLCTLSEAHPLCSSICCYENCGLTQTLSKWQQVGCGENNLLA